uniref:UEV domain-containing protein n=1 Tax=Heterorhabditis bacteriophora TaxID=37862 RepID=A0A1I7XRG8_HETBA
MSVHQVQQCLEKASIKYVDSAKADIMGALREFKDLSPDTEHFMFPDGKRRHAFKLRGTIPVFYKMSTCYNIPISVYLWDTHPYYAPICYVNPTATMVIKESENVNKQGRIFLPYLNEWRFPGYDLNGLLQFCTKIMHKCLNIQDKKAELTRSLENCDDESNVNDIDSAIDAATPLHRQLLTNYAQDLACDDVIYSLGQALKERRISIQEYLRYVRDISRKQFVFRATMQKCRKAAGLPI